MYKSHIVTGKVIEIRDQQVLTLQGDIVCSYNKNYYLLPVEEELSLMEPEFAQEVSEAEAGGLLSRDWKPLLSWVFIWKRSANRV